MSNQLDSDQLASAKLSASELIYNDVVRYRALRDHWEHFGNLELQNAYARIVFALESEQAGLRR